MKKILFTLFVLLQVNSFAQIQKESAPGPKFSMNMQTYIREGFNGAGISAYKVRRGFILGGTSSIFLTKKISRFMNNQHDQLFTMNLIAGTDIKLGKGISFTIYGGPGIGFAERVENIRYSTTTGWLVVTYTKSTVEYDIVKYKVFNLKLNGMINFKLNRRTCFQAGVNADLNRFYKSPYVAIGLKWNY